MSGARLSSPLPPHVSYVSPALPGHSAAVLATGSRESLLPPPLTQRTLRDSSHGECLGCGFRVTCILISETLRRRDSRDGNALFHEGSQECVIFQEHDRSPLQRGKGTKTHGACWEAVAAMPARADGACPGGGRRRRSSKPT